MDNFIFLELITCSLNISLNLKVSVDEVNIFYKRIFFLIIFLHLGADGYVFDV